MSKTAENSELTEPTHTFQEGIGSHPLWPMYLAELEASRQADIAEANRLADLEEMVGGADTMNTSVKTEAKPLPPASGNSANGSVHSAEAEWPIPQFKHNLGDNPLWDEFMEEMKKNRQADIAEANRLADLELEQQG